MKNVAALGGFALAAETYLRQNGWKKENSKHWIVPSQFGIYAGDKYLFWNAVKFQMEHDV